MKRGITAMQLNIIAMIVIIIDHVAWTVLGPESFMTQLLHIFGTMAVPIISLITAEGYRHSSRQDKFIMKIMLLWLVSIIPYYLFYHFTYGIRQNLMFDMFLGLLTLKILTSNNFPKKDKIILSILLEVISFMFSSWPVISLAFILMFYFVTDKKKRMQWGIFLTLITSFILALGRIININFDILGIISSRSHVWICIGFFLALPIIKIYNNERGNKMYFRYLAYTLYPVHFVILEFMFYATSKQVYFGYVHLLCGVMIITFLLGVFCLRLKPSKAQLANVILISFSLFYMVGYYFQITASEAAVALTALKIEYFGFTGMILAYTWFFETFCEGKWRRWIYVVEIIMTIIVDCSIFISDICPIFIKSCYMRKYSCHSTLVLEPGIVYILFLHYFVIFCFMSILTSVKKIRKSTGIERHRCILIGIGECFPVTIVILRRTGAFREYGMETLGMLGFLIFFTVALVKYEYFDSIQTEAEIDCLTGVSNRGYFVERVGMNLSKRRKGSLIMLDVDNFKKINDSFGHGIGDKILIILGNSLIEAVGKENIVCRLGGDEFSIFLLDMVELNEVEKVAKNIAKTFKRNVYNNDLKFEVSLSLGIAIYEGMRNIIFDTLYEKADKALYLAKNSGKGQYKFYERNSSNT